MFFMELPADIYGYILPALMAASAAVHLTYTLRYHLKAARWNDHNGATQHNEPVSVVICARNEAEALAANLPAIFEQKHAAFEVVVVNDSSEDDSDLVLSRLKAQYPGLKISTIARDPRFHRNRKLAHVVGIKAATNDLLLLTEPGCRPASGSWLTQMTAPMAAGRDIVLGYGGYHAGRGLLNRYMRYDTMTGAMQYAGMALTGRPFRGVGRNLAYRKSLFMKSNGFASHYHLPSGYDGLFVNTTATTSNTAVVLGESSHTRAEPPATAAGYIRDRRMQMASVPMYPTRDRLLMAAEPMARAVFYLSTAILTATLNMWQVTAPLATIVIGIRAMVLHRASICFAEKGITAYAVLFDILSPFIDSLLYIAKFGNKAGTRAWR